MEQTYIIEIKRRDVGMLLLLSVLYGLLNISGIQVPRLCLFFNITGIPCPFCGITRGVLSLTRLEFADAVLYHPFSLAVLPVFLVGSALVLVEAKQVSVQLNSIRIAVAAVLVLSTWVVKLVWVDQAYW